MKLLKREGLNDYVISIIDNDNREIAITERDWQRISRIMKRFLKMSNTSTITLA